MGQPNYDLLIAVHLGVVVLGYCAYELLATYLFSDEEKQQMKDNKNHQQQE